MPFEPLKTDEKLEAPTKREHSMDDLMLAGCASFLAASLITYALAVWPYFLFLHSSRLQDLLLAVAIGMVPSLAFGAFMSRRYGLPGATGFVGGSMAVAVFLHLNIKRILLAVLLDERGNPEIPPILIYLVPLFWLLGSLFVALMWIPREELPGHDEPGP